MAPTKRIDDAADADRDRRARDRLSPVNSDRDRDQRLTGAALSDMGYELCRRVISIRYFEGAPVQIAAYCGIARNPGATGSLSLGVWFPGASWPIARQEVPGRIDPPAQGLGIRLRPVAFDPPRSPLVTYCHIDFRYLRTSSHFPASATDGDQFGFVARRKWHQKWHLPAGPPTPPGPRAAMSSLGS
jgi:hypothetical protein